MHMAVEKAVSRKDRRAVGQTVDPILPRMESILRRPPRGTKKRPFSQTLKFAGGGVLAVAQPYKQAVNRVSDVLQMRVTKLRRIFQSVTDHAVEAEMREPDQSVRRELWCRQNRGQK